MLAMSYAIARKQEIEEKSAREKAIDAFFTSEISINNQKYKIGKIIGEGTNANVYELEEVVCELKEVDYKQSKTPKVIKVFHDNINGLANISNEVIASSLNYNVEIIKNKYVTAIIMDKIPGKELFNILHDQRSGNLDDDFSFLKRVVIINQLARLIAYYHKNGLIHRDLKPENILVDSENDNNFQVCSIIDFGYASRIDDITKLHELPLCGTYGYIAPESATILNNKGNPNVYAGSPSDVFSLATIACELFFNPQCMLNELRFYGSDSDSLLGDKKLLGNKDDEKSKMPDLDNVLCHFLAHMLNRDPVKRANIIVLENFFHSLQQLCFLSKSEFEGSSTEGQAIYLQEQLEFHIVRLRLLVNYPQLPENKIPESISNLTSEHRKFLQKEIPEFDNADNHESVLSVYLIEINSPEIKEIPIKPKKSLKEPETTPTPVGSETLAQKVHAM